MIIFRKIFWKNLLSTGNNGIEIQLDSNKTCILFGPSGSGKSTLLDAITFCLFNKPFRNINKPKLVNGINEGDCLVEVHFDVHGKSYKIIRGIKPNIFEIYENGNLLNQDSNSRDYQAVLEQQILKINYKTFLQVVMLGAANFTPFMQLKPQDRRLIIEDLLDIQIFSVMNGLLKEKFSSNKQKLNELDVKLATVEQKIQLTARHLKTLESQKNDRIEEIKDQIDDFLSKRTECILVRDSLKSQKDQIIIENLSTIESMAKKYNNVEVALKTNKSRLVRDIEFYKNNDWCNTCKQSISQEVKDREIQTKENALAEIQTGLNEIQIATAELLNKKSKILADQDSIKKLDEEIKQADMSIQYYDDIVKKNLIDIEKVKAADGELLIYRTELDSHQAEKSDLMQQKNESLKIQQTMEYANLILKDSGVKSKIVKQYVPYINKYVNLFLNAMSFFVTFKLDENFEEQIKSKGRDFFSYENFSEGERQRLDLALLFTWRCIAKAKNSINTNLLIMDEVLDSYLDTSATESVLSIFGESMFDDSNIIVISHKENIVDKFDRVIKYKIEKGFSKVEI